MNKLKISTQGRYGLRALVDLAENENDGAIPLREISERQKISERYLEQLFAKLRKAGLVKSVRGAHGGYMLNRDPEEITVGDVIITLEGSIAPVECTKAGEGSCEMLPQCATHEVWVKIKDKINEVVEAITVEDLKQRARELHHQQEKGYMYYI